MSNFFSFSMALVVAFVALLPSPALSSSLAATVTGNDGEFYVNLLIGTPPKNYNLLLDTGSNLIWAANYKTSTSYSKLPCYSNLCAKAKGSCDKSCHYKYTSTNHTKLSVGLATETFIFANAMVPQQSRLAFANNAAVESFVMGGLGLGRSPLSLVSQTNEQKLSYCLPDYDHPDKKGFLYVGSLAKSHPPMITTSLVNNPSINPSAYYIKVQGMSVNNVSLPIDKSAFEINEKNGNGGFIIDTGSTMTYLNEKIFNPLANELRKHIPLKPTKIDNVNLPICYNIPTNISLPSITIHFSPWSKLTLSLGNTFREYTFTTKKQNISCLAMAVAPPSDNGMSSLGNIQLQNTLVFFDLAKQTVGFLPNTDCDAVRKFQGALHILAVSELTVFTSMDGGVCRPKDGGGVHRVGVLFIEADADMMLWQFRDNSHTYCSSLQYI